MPEHIKEREEKKYSVKREGIWGSKAWSCARLDFEREWRGCIWEFFIRGVIALHEENVFDRFHTVFSLLSLYGYTLSVICWICFGRLERYLWACRALGRIRLSFFVVIFSFSLLLCISLVLLFPLFSSKLLFFIFFLLLFKSYLSAFFWLRNMTPVLYGGFFCKLRKLGGGGMKMEHGQTVFLVNTQQ